MRALARFGFRVLEAAAGEHALALAEMSSPHVVITEATLPRRGGLEQYVRDHKIPHIVTVTDAMAIPAVDAVAVLEKPFSLLLLLNHVFRALRA